MGRAAAMENQIPSNPGLLNHAFLAKLRNPTSEGPVNYGWYCLKCRRVRASSLVTPPYWLDDCSVSTCTPQCRPAVPRGKSAKLDLVQRRRSIGEAEDLDALLANTVFFKSVRSIPGGGFVAVGSSGAEEKYCRYFLGSWTEAPPTDRSGLLAFATVE